MSVRYDPERKRYLAYVCEGTRRYRRYFRTAKEAKAAEASARREFSKERIPDKGLEAALAKYVEEHLPYLKDQRGGVSIAGMLLPFLEGKAFSQVPEVAQAIAREGKARGLKQQTINHRLKLLRHLCRLAHLKWRPRWIDEPIYTCIEIPNPRNRRTLFPSVEDAERIFAHCRPAVADFLRLAIWTGCRKGELFGLRPRHRYANGIMLDTNTKTGEPRYVPVPEDLRHLLDKLPLPVTPQVVRTDFEKARVLAGLPDVTIHDLRHSYGSRLAALGMPTKTIGTLMGHANTSTTNRYLHLHTETLDQVIDQLSKRA